MKNLRFALCGIFIQSALVAVTFVVLTAAAALFVLGSCSLGENDSEKQTAAEETTEDESGAVTKPPITKPGGGKPQDKNSSDDDPSDDDPSEEDPPDDRDDDYQHEEDPSDENPFDDEDDDPFSPNMPSILINEIRTEYSGTGFWAEYIEFKMLSSGNLDGLKVFIAGNTQNPLVFEFLPVQVKKREYVVLHLRTLDDKWVNEYGDDLNESGGNDSSPNARDFWVPGNAELLHKTDAVYITDKDDNILDAVMFAENSLPPKSVDFFFAAADFLFNNGAWMSPNGTLPGHEDAVKSSPLGSAKTRSLSRDESTPDTNTAADWYVTADKGYSPGKKNSAK